MKVSILLCFLENIVKRSALLNMNYQRRFTQATKGPQTNIDNNNWKMYLDAIFTLKDNEILISNNKK